MSTDGIDARRLKEAIRRLHDYFSDGSQCVMDKHLSHEDLRALRAAAEAHLATLPREVEVETWVIANAHGDVGPRTFSCKQGAEGAIAMSGADAVAVRLTGTAVLPKG